MIELQQIGELVQAKGCGWRYQRLGDKKIFSFTGKTAPRRQIRELVKPLEKENGAT